MLKKRLIAALVILPPVILLIWFSVLSTAILAALWGGVASFEFYQMVSRAKVKPLTYLGLLWSVLFTISPYFEKAFLPPLLLAGGAVLTLARLLFEPEKEGVFSRWVWTLGGATYIGWLMSYLVAIRGGFAPLDTGGDVGRNWLYYALFTTFGSDTLAYLVGRVAGRHYLAPYISPAKTWEGTAGGIIGAVIVSLLFRLPSPLRLSLSFFQAVFLGLTVSLFGQLGDLVKSLLKRNMGVKDSSNLIPGHGGFLDRIDSVLFVGVVIYYYLLLLA